MAAPSLIVLHLFEFLSIFMISSAHGVSIQLFKDSKVSELLWETSSNAECINTPRSKLADVYSIRTDSCLIVYFNPDCKSQWSVKYPPGDISLSESDLTWIESFHVCNEREGGNQLNVDITKLKDDTLTAEVVKSYKNICSCVNIPKIVENMRAWSIDNHHNALLVYFEPRCSEDKWKSKLLAAGHNLESNFMNELKETDSVTEMVYKVQSFGPDPNSLYSQINCNSSLVVTESPTTTSESPNEQAEDANADQDEREMDVYIPYNEGGLDTDVDLYEQGPLANDEINARRMAANISLTKRFQALTNQFVELQTRIDQSTQNLENFHTGVLKKHNEEFNNFTERITELHQGFRNFTEKVKLVLHELRT